MPHHQRRCPNESDGYRAARDELLSMEIELREQLARIAEQRRQLPAGGLLKEDYEFDGMDSAGQAAKVKLSELFEAGKDSLVIYSYMHAPSMDEPCSACTSLLDGLNGSGAHIRQRVNFAVVGKSPLAALEAIARERGWINLQLLSSASNSYNTDYHAETDGGAQMPACNVFVKSGDEVRHFYSTELLYADLEGHPRHMDLAWPIWNVFDMTPEGRGTDWFPRLSY